MPVLRHHDIGKALCDPVDHREDRSAVLTARRRRAGKQFWKSIQQREQSSILIEAVTPSALK